MPGRGRSWFLCPSNSQQSAPTTQQSPAAIQTAPAWWGAGWEMRVGGSHPLWAPSAPACLKPCSEQSGALKGNGDDVDHPFIKQAAAMSPPRAGLADLLRAAQPRMGFAAVREQWLPSLSTTHSEGSNPFLLSRTVIVAYSNRSIERWETSSENLHVHKGFFQRFLIFTITFSVPVVSTTWWSISLHWWCPNNHPAPPGQPWVWHCWSSLNNFDFHLQRLLMKDWNSFSGTSSLRCTKSWVTLSCSFSTKAPSSLQTPAARN